MYKTRVINLMNVTPKKFYNTSKGTTVDFHQVKIMLKLDYEGNHIKRGLQKQYIFINATKKKNIHTNIHILYLLMCSHLVV